MRFFKGKILTQMALFFSVLFLVVFGTLFYFFQQAQKEILRKDFEEKSSTVINYVKFGLEYGFNKNNMTIKDTVLSWIKNDKSVKFLTLLDEKTFNVLLMYPDTSKYVINLLSRPSKIFDFSDKIIIRHDKISSGIGNILLIIGFDQTENIIKSENQLNNLRNITAIILIFGLILTFLISKTISKPLVILSNTAKKIGEFKTKVEVEENSDIEEINDLAESINFMTSRLIEANNEIAQQNLELKEYNEALKSEIEFRRIIEEAKKRSEKLLEAIINTAPAVISFIDNKYTYVITNLYHSSNFGLTPKDVIGKRLTDLFSPEQTEFLINKFEEARITRKIISYNLNIIVNGKQRYYLSTISAYFNDADEYLGTVLISVNITELVETQKEMKFINASLQAQQDLSPDGILIYDKNGNIISINNKYYEIFDIDRNLNLSNEKVVELALSKVVNNDQLVDLIGYVKSRSTETLTTELILKQNKYLIRYLIPLISHDNEYLGVVLYIKDVTEERKVRNDLENALKSAELANKAKTEFLANMSHEIRTPLNAILGFSQILSTKVIDSNLISYLEAINSSGKNLLSLINDILDLSKIEAGRLELDIDSINIFNLFNEIKNIFQYKFQEKKLEFIINIEEGLPEALLLDEVRLRQILVNLVGNAVKFTESGYVILSVKREYVYQDKSKLDLIISIEDTGIGIPESERERVFDAFRQQSGQSNRKYGGTGLGLSITKRLINIMSGDITIKSNIPNGTIFEIILRDISVPSTLSIKDNILSNKEFEVSFGNLNILLVDDIDINRRLIIEYIDSPNVKFYEAENGLDAIELAREKLPDLIMMDIKMPTMDGFEAINHLRNEPKSSKIPIIALTASATKDDADRILKAGFNSYIPKPIDKFRLITEIRKIYPDKVLNIKQKVESKNDIIQPVTSSEIVDKSLLYKILSEKILNEINSARSSLIIGKISAISQDLKNIAIKHNSSELEEYADKLKDFTNNFDIIHIRKTLDNFEEFIKIFK